MPRRVLALTLLVPRCDLVSGRLRAALRFPGPARDRTVALAPGTPLAPGGCHFVRLRPGADPASARVGVFD